MSEVVWVAVLDGEWECKVTRTGEYQGQLTMRRVGSEEAEPALTSEVPLAYDAKFGPDAGDVQEWMELCMEAADANV